MLKCSNKVACTQLEASHFNIMKTKFPSIQIHHRSWLITVQKSGNPSESCENNIPRNLSEIRNFVSETGAQVYTSIFSSRPEVLWSARHLVRDTSTATSKLNCVTRRARLIMARHMETEPTSTQYGCQIVVPAVPGSESLCTPLNSELRN
jgi:hypothetical protein